MSDHSDAGDEMRNEDRTEQQEQDDDKELAAMKARVAEMEAEAAKLRELQAQAEKQMADEGGSEEDKAAVDARSIYIGNVDYGATPEEIQAHFASAGTINRVTILVDKYTSHPKGYAYVEFAEPSLVEHALHLNESLFRGRLITVAAKRANIPGFNKRGRGRGGYRGGYQPRGGFNPYARGRGRGRGRGW